MIYFRPRFRMAAREPMRGPNVARDAAGCKGRKAGKAALTGGGKRCRRHFGMVPIGKEFE